MRVILFLVCVLLVSQCIELTEEIELAQLSKKLEELSGESGTGHMILDLAQMHSEMNAPLGMISLVVYNVYRGFGDSNQIVGGGH